MEWNKIKYTQETLTRLNREELRKLLTEELAKETADIDDLLVRQLLGELDARGKDPSFVDDEKIEAVCDKFRSDMEKDGQKKKYWYQGWLLKVASIVLVLGVLFFSLPSAAQADNVKEVLSWWSDSVFQFFAPGEHPVEKEYVFETDHPGLQQIYEAVEEMGIEEPIVPRWLPDGFELLELKTIQMAEDRSLVARAESNKRNILFTIVVHSEEETFQYEKDEEKIIVWDLAGNEHYLLSNKDERVITWMTKGIECTIITDCLEEEVYRIIKSIYTSEG